MKAEYFPETDQLCITLSSTPAFGGGSQVSDGIWCFYDENDKVVSIEFEFASNKVNLADIKNNPTRLIKEPTKPTAT